MDYKHTSYDIRYFDSYRDTYVNANECLTEDEAKERAKFLATQFGSVRIVKRTVIEETIGTMVNKDLNSNRV